MLKKIKNIAIFFVIYTISFDNAFSMQADVFVQSTVNRASKILSKDISKSEKIVELKKIAKETVDIKGIGLYTLGAARKSQSDENLKIYNELCEEYFLKSFSSRLAEYSTPEIDVYDKEVLNQN